MKSTPSRGVKQFLKPDAYKQWEPPCGVTAYLLYNGSATCGVQRAGAARLRRSESESEQGASVAGRGPETG